ncbi:hypothetical protein TcBrA4_0126140 [Trypanosoma cruzi]|nr:hypothetical protein TcBrA4_0126140 [Trypanosoma cruzi]
MEDLIRRNEDLQALLKDSRCSMEKMQSVVATITDRNNEWEREITERQRQIVLLQASLDEATSERTFAEKNCRFTAHGGKSAESAKCPGKCRNGLQDRDVQAKTKKEPLEACAKNDSPDEDFPITQIGKTRRKRNECCKNSSPEPKSKKSRGTG